jgi:hypothetical protein
MIAEVARQCFRFYAFRGAGAITPGILLDYLNSMKKDEPLIQLLKKFLPGEVLRVRIDPERNQYGVIIQWQSPLHHKFL